MKHYSVLLFILIYILASSSFANSKSKLNQDSTFIHNGTVFVNKIDTVRIQNIQNEEYVTSFDWQKNMPWMGAILIGILTVLANLIISNQYRKSNKEVSDRQINNSKEIALAQIENVRKSVELDFNKTVLSGNRQSWINELRVLISQILSKTMAISAKQNISNKEFEKLRFLITKAELMLNVTTDKDFISALSELENCYLEILMGNMHAVDLEENIEKVKRHTKITLKTEWERVKKGE
jgi:hypothetical protein